MNSGEEVLGPFGAARKVGSVSVDQIVAAYRNKCGADVSRSFERLREVDLYECQVTRYRFWRPETIAADEEIYRRLSAAWSDYYRSERWEYKFVRSSLRKTDRVLEVGCGRGYFLHSIERVVREAVGLELNTEAIEQKVTKCEILPRMLADYCSEAAGTFDVACSFQVLEHVVDPALFIRLCVACLRPGGRLFLSTPNMDSAALLAREDAFDMPPHHMGHFSGETYRAISRVLGLEVVELRVQRKFSSAVDTLSMRTRNHLLYRLGIRLTRRVLNFIYWILREPGAYILVAFQKRA